MSYRKFLRWSCIEIESQQVTWKPFEAQSFSREGFYVQNPLKKGSPFFNQKSQPFCVLVFTCDLHVPGGPSTKMEQPQTCDGTTGQAFWETSSISTNWTWQPKERLEA